LRTREHKLPICIYKQSTIIICILYDIRNLVIKHCRLYLGVHRYTVWTRQLRPLRRGTQNIISCGIIYGNYGSTTNRKSGCEFETWVSTFSSLLQRSVILFRYIRKQKQQKERIYLYHRYYNIIMLYCWGIKRDGVMTKQCL